MIALIVGLLSMTSRRIQVDELEYWLEIADTNTSPLAEPARHLHTKFVSRDGVVLFVFVDATAAFPCLGSARLSRLSALN